jgi:hypothetical protein
LTRLAFAFGPEALAFSLFALSPYPLAFSLAKPR